MKNFWSVLVGICILAACSGRKEKRSLSYYDIVNKITKVRYECLVYAENHNGKYPSSLDLLVSSGQIDQKTLEESFNVKDKDGPGRERHLVYTPDGSDLLFFTTYPVIYRQVLDGKTTVETVWVVVDRKATAQLLTFEKLPADVRERIGVIPNKIPGK
jgi:hypothetical protein